VPITMLDGPGAFEFFILISDEIREAMEKYLQDRVKRGTSPTAGNPQFRGVTLCHSRIRSSNTRERPRQ